MQSIKRDLSLCLAVSALVFTGALAWGSPFTTAASGTQAAVVSGQTQAQQPGQESGQAQQPQQGQMQQQQTQQKAKTFTGTVVKSGSGYVLRDSSGQAYQLDASDQAKAFEGKTVMVLGQLDPNSNTIHVQSIQAASSY
ncbi:MAG: DUF5818 domain-containing protein [Acidobacteriota bacterium]